MPTYSYRCKNCHNDFEIIHRMSDHSIYQSCELCGGIAEQIIYAPILIMVSDVRYESPVDGRLINNQRERNNDLAKHGCIPYEIGMKQDSERKIKADDDCLMSAIETSYDQTLAMMSSVKKERLEAEMAADIDINYVRR